MSSWTSSAPSSGGSAGRRPFPRFAGGTGPLRAPAPGDTSLPAPPPAPRPGAPLPPGRAAPDSPAERVALLRRHWREGDMSHNLAVAAMAGLPFEQARQLALLPPREPDAL